MVLSVGEIGIADYLPSIIKPECVAVATEGPDISQDTARQPNQAPANLPRHRHPHLVVHPSR